MILSAKQKQVPVGMLWLAACSPVRFHRAEDHQGEGMPMLVRFGAGTVGMSHEGVCAALEEHAVSEM